VIVNYPNILQADAATAKHLINVEIYRLPLLYFSLPFT